MILDKESADILVPLEKLGDCEVVIFSEVFVTACETSCGVAIICIVDVVFSTPSASDATSLVSTDSVATTVVRSLVVSTIE